MSEHTIPSEKKIPELSLSEVVQFIKKYILKVFLVSFIFGILGYSVSFLLPVSYKSSTILLPESSPSSNGMSSLSGLARLSGLAKNESGGALQPELYPPVLQTVPFALHMLGQSLVDKNNHSYKSLREFLHRNKPEKESPNQVNYTSNISKQILSLSKSEELDTKQVLSIINANYDVKMGIITIDSEIDDPVVAAQLVEFASNYLIQYVSDYRTEKTVRESHFLGQRVTEAKKREQNAEFELQSYRDRNRNSFLNVARIEEQRLQAEYLLSQSLYSDIVRRWEDSKIKVKEQQPVIKVLEPAKVATVKSKPRRTIVALIFALVGLLTTSLYIFLFTKKSEPI